MIIPRQNILYKISLFQGLEEFKDDRYPNSIYYLKYGKIYFELDVEKRILFCDFDLVWKVLSNKSKLDYDETQRIIMNMVERYTNLGSVTPICEYNINL